MQVVQEDDDGLLCGQGGEILAHPGEDCLLAGRDLAAAMEEIFATDCSNSLELTEHEWQARDMHRKFTEYVLTPLRPFL